MLSYSTHISNKSDEDKIVEKNQVDAFSFWYLHLQSSPLRFEYGHSEQRLSGFNHELLQLCGDAKAVDSNATSASASIFHFKY